MNQISLPPLFYVLRHGATDWNDQGLLLGSQDIPMNEKGRRRIEKAAQLLKTVPIAKVISSPLLRAQETADILGFPFEIDERLREAHLGEREGEPKTQEKLFAWQKCEEYRAFEERALSAFENCEPSTLFVTHGNVLEALLRHLGLSWDDVSERSTKGRPLKFEKKAQRWKVEFL